MSRLTIENLRFIVFLLDRKYLQSDGVVFTRLEDARKFVDEEMNEYPNSRVIIGSFLEDPNSRERYIEKIETFGFKGDKKYSSQMKLF